MPLPFSPVASVSSVTYLDDAGGSQTLAGTAWRLQTGHAGPYVEIDDDVTLPTLDYRDDAVTVTFVAGYGAAAAVPAAIQHALIMIVAEMYDHREDAVIGQTVARVPIIVDRLVAPYRRVMA